MALEIILCPWTGISSLDQTRGFKAPSTWALNTSRDGAAPAYLGSLFHHFSTSESALLHPSVNVQHLQSWVLYWLKSLICLQVDPCSSWSSNWALDWCVNTWRWNWSLSSIKHSIKLILAPDGDLLLISSIQKEKKMQASSFKDISGAWVRENGLRWIFFCPFFLFFRNVDMYYKERKKMCYFISLESLPGLFSHIWSLLFSGSNQLNNWLTDDQPVLFQSAGCNAREKWGNLHWLFFFHTLVLYCPNKEIGVIGAYTFSFFFFFLKCPSALTQIPQSSPCTFFQLNCFS